MTTRPIPAGYAETVHEAAMVEEHNARLAHGDALWCVFDADKLMRGACKASDRDDAIRKIAAWHSTGHTDGWSVHRADW